MGPGGGDSTDLGTGDRRCPLCGLGPLEEILRGTDPRFPIVGTFAVLWCERCAIGSTHPAPDPNELAMHYPPDYDPFRPGTEDAAHSGLRRGLLAAERRFKASVAGATGTGSLLDVGCGNGDFMETMAARGFLVLGIDTSPLATAEVTRRGMRAITGDFLQIPLLRESFDVVSMNHVLEHVRQPRASLARARDLLRPGGRLLVGVPNFASWERTHFGADWSDLELPRHLFHFTPAGLTRLIEEAGFRVLRVRADPTADANSVLTSLLVRNGKRGDPLVSKVYPFLHAALYPVGVPLALVGRSAWIRAAAIKPAGPAAPSDGA